MKFWKAQLKDKTIVTEGDQGKTWDNIKKDVVALEFNNDGQVIKLPDNAESYIQGKSATGNLATGACSILSRYIGVQVGNSIVKIRINETTNHISVELTNVKPNNHSFSSKLT